MLDGAPVGNIGRQGLGDIFNSPAMQELPQKHVEGRAGEIDMCLRCCTTIPHPVLVAGSLIFNGETVRKLLPWVERLTYLSKLPRKLLSPPKPAVRRAEELVQISPSKTGDRK